MKINLIRTAFCRLSAESLVYQGFIIRTAILSKEGFGIYLRYC